MSLVLQRLQSQLPANLRSHLRSARELAQEVRNAEAVGAAFPISIPCFDRLLAGGFPRGELVELIGSRSSGRFSILLASIAAATTAGEVAVLVDLGDNLDPGGALHAGVDLQRLLWVRPTTVKNALAATEMLIVGGFPLVALDLGQRSGKGMDAAWLRLARTAKARGSALVVATSCRESGTAAAVVLKVAEGRPVWRGGGRAPWLLAGVAARVLLEKSRGRIPGQAESFVLTSAARPRPARPRPSTTLSPRSLDIQAREERRSTSAGLRLAAG